MKVKVIGYRVGKDERWLEEPSPFEAEFDNLQNFVRGGEKYVPIYKHISGVDYHRVIPTGEIVDNRTTS